MLQEQLKRTGNLRGKSVELTISATGYIVDAYDVYVDIYGFTSKDAKGSDVTHQIFIRLIFWETTHKQILIGTVTVLDGKGLPKHVIENIEKCSIPVEKKEYWKKAFEKAVVVEIAQCMSRPASVGGGLDFLNDMCKKPDTTITLASAHSCSIASYESVTRNGSGSAYPAGRSGELPTDKCWEGSHGFVRSDRADDLDLKPVSMPVTTIVK